jgi:hypothetical protein
MAPSLTLGLNWKNLALGVLALSVILLIGLGSYHYLFRSDEVNTESDISLEPTPEAELVSSSGTVLLRQPGLPEWQVVKRGAALTEGSLIRTEGGGSAAIRFTDGSTVLVQENTIFTVQSADSSAMEISPPPQMALLVGDSGKAGEGSTRPPRGSAKAGNLQPSIVLQRIIPFGRSLELIGTVDAGSRLVVNGKSVEVNGDGTYKHFTNPFPDYARKVNIVMTVTNLAGKNRTLRTTYDFSSHSEDN